MKRLAIHYNKRLTSDEAERICGITIVFNLIAIVFLGFFAVVSYRTDTPHYAVILLGIMMFTILNISYFLFAGKMRPFILITCFSYLAFCVYLQISGGEDNSGILWHYVYPIMVYYIAGIRMGAACAGALIFLEIVLMVFDDLFPFQTQYPLAFKLRFIASMSVMSVFGAMLESSRRSAQRSLREIARKFHLAAQTDELTGLANRRALNEKLDDEVVRSERTQHDFVIIMCDIDHFKNINDRYGHSTGDLVLKQIAKNFKELLRKYDIASRWGGEEFLILLPETNLENGLMVAERLREYIEKLHIQTDAGEAIGLTISCGGSNWKSHRNIDALIRKSDDLLYVAKQSGRNRVVWDG